MEWEHVAAGSSADAPSRSPIAWSMLALTQASNNATSRSGTTASLRFNNRGKHAGKVSKHVRERA